MSVTSIRSDVLLVATRIQKPTCPNMYLHLRYKKLCPSCISNGGTSEKQKHMFPVKNFHCFEILIRTKTSMCAEYKLIVLMEHYCLNPSNY